MALEWIKKTEVSPLRMLKGKRRTNSKARDLICNKRGVLKFLLALKHIAFCFQHCIFYIGTMRQHMINIHIQEDSVSKP